MEKVLLIVNPVSGKMKAKSSLLDVVTVLQKKDMSVTVGITEYRGHATEMALKAEGQGFDKVICFGGDGTLNETITGLMKAESKLPLGYIPAGSTNDFAASMKLSNVPARAALTVCEGKSNPIDIGHFNNDRYFTYVAGFGAFTKCSYSVAQGMKNLLGHFAYVLGSVKEIASIRSYNIKVELDGKTVEGDYIFVSVTNSTSVAGIVKLNDELVDMSDGVFEVALVKKPRNIIELNKIISAITSSNFENGGIEFYKSSKIKIVTDQKLDWTLDGEHAVSEGDVVVENINHAITFLR